jgi:hypothetical protein
MYAAICLVCSALVVLAARLLASGLAVLLGLGLLPRRAVRAIRAAARSASGPQRNRRPSAHGRVSDRSIGMPS